MMGGVVSVLVALTLRVIRRVAFLRLAHDSRARRAWSRFDRDRALTARSTRVPAPFGIAPNPGLGVSAPWICC